MIRLDRATSTVTIGDPGRRYPAVILVCPPHESYPDESDWDRALCAESTDQHATYIPAENGLLFYVQSGWLNGPRPDLVTLALDTRTCWIDDDDDDWIGWLPRHVWLHNGDLRCADSRWDCPPPGAHTVWPNADPDWVIETIDRLSRKPFTPLPGPEVRLVRLDYFEDATV